MLWNRGLARVLPTIVGKVLVRLPTGVVADHPTNLRLAEVRVPRAMDQVPAAAEYGDIGQAHGPCDALCQGTTLFVMWPTVRGVRDCMSLTKALADANRVRMLLALRRGELWACQLTRLFGRTPSTMSKQLAILYPHLARAIRCVGYRPRAVRLRDAECVVTAVTVGNDELHGRTCRRAPDRQAQVWRFVQRRTDAPATANGLPVSPRAAGPAAKPAPARARSGIAFDSSRNPIARQGAPQHDGARRGKSGCHAAWELARLEQVQHMVEFLGGGPASQAEAHGAETDGFGHAHRLQDGREFVASAVEDEARRQHCLRRLRQLKERLGRPPACSRSTEQPATHGPSGTDHLASLSTDWRVTPQHTGGRRNAVFADDHAGPEAR